MSGRPSRGSITIGTSPTMASSSCATSSTCHLRSCLPLSRSLPGLLAALLALAHLVTAQGGHLALRVTDLGMVTGMATVAVLVVHLVTLVVRKVEPLQSSSHHSGALVVVALAVAQWSELPPSLDVMFLSLSFA